MGRIAIVVCLTLVATTTAAFAKPRIAVLPIEGDARDKIGEIIGEVLADRGSVQGSAKVSRAMDKAGVSGKLSAKDVRKVQDELDADVVIYGKVDKDGRTRTLRLMVRIGDRKPDRVTFKFKSSATLRKEIRSEIASKLEEVEEAEEVEEVKRRSPFANKDRDRDDDKDKDRDDEDDRDKDRDRDDERARKDKERARDKERAERGRERERDKDRARKDKDRDKRRTRIADKDDDDDDDDGDDDDDDGERKVRKKKRKRRGDDDGVAKGPHPLTQLVARGGAGASIGLRRLTYAFTGTAAPPKVSTGAPGARIEGEIYPLELAGVKGPIAGIGIHGGYDKTLGLSITVPGGLGETPIDQTHYAIGVRYRFKFGASAAGFGASYFRRNYVADRSGLAMPGQLDMPDVDYSAVAVGGFGRFALAPKAALFVDADALLITNTGPIQETNSFGAADVFGFVLDVGVDISLSKQIALRLGGELTQITFSFAGTGDMSSRRDVSGATDRVFGLTAGLAATY